MVGTVVAPDTLPALGEPRALPPKVGQSLQGARAPLAWPLFLGIALEVPHRSPSPDASSTDPTREGAVLRLELRPLRRGRFQVQSSVAPDSWPVTL
eukprot:5600990-Alexandrium_andersonii.AAC.1